MPYFLESMLNMQGHNASLVMIRESEIDKMFRKTVERQKKGGGEIHKN